MFPKKMAIMPAVNAMMKEEYTLFAVAALSENASTMNSRMAQTILTNTASRRPTRMNIRRAHSATGRA